MKKLPINHAVTFNEEAHTYTLFDGTQLSGITSIIHKYLFPSMYDGVSSSVMEAARNRGHMIHKALEDCLFNGAPLFDGFEFDREVRECLGIVAENKLKPVAGEYLVSDNAHIATCIDGVFKQGKKMVLVDHKTTSVIYTEYLQWQLSIEAVLFEQQTGNKVDTLYAIHLPKNGECKLVEIERLPDEYVTALLDAFINETKFDNPLHRLSDDTNELIEQYKQSELALLELQASVDYHKQIQADIKARIKEQMDAESASKWENDSVTITRSKDSVRKTFKPDMLMQQTDDVVITEWLGKNMPKCYQETKVNGNVTIKFK